MATIYCPNCVTQAAEGAAFCAGCGQALGQTQPTQAASTTPAHPPPAPRKRSKRAGIIGGIIGLLLLGCLGLLALGALLGPDDTNGETGDHGDHGATNGTANGSTGLNADQGKAASTKAEPGVVSGKITDSAGKPIEGAEVRILGTTSAGEDVSYYPKSGADGTYSTRVADGVYSIDASLTRDYSGRSFEFTLHPTDNTDNEFDSQGGIARDFVWKLSGFEPGGLKENYFSYYGGNIQMSYRTPDDAQFYGIPYPEESVATFTLTPTGPLADGSQGKPIKFERTAADLDRSDGAIDDTSNLYDIPLGPYTLTGTLKTPDGTSVPLVFRTAYTQEQFAPSVEVNWTKPAITGGADPLSVEFQGQGTAGFEAAPWPQLRGGCRCDEREVRQEQVGRW